MTTKASEKLSLEIKRFINAPRDRVYEAWTDPASKSIAEGWRAGAAKALERQFAGFVPEGGANPSEKKRNN